MTFWDQLLEWLLKYPLTWFGQGELGLSNASWYVFALTCGGLGVLALLSARLNLRAWRPWRDLLGLTFLRTLALSLLLLCLFQPVLLRPADTQQRASVAVLLDDSLSMGISMGITDNDQTRADFIRTQFNPDDGPLAQALGRDFDLALFRFGLGTELVERADTLTFTQAGTDLAQALTYLEHALSGVALAGVVVVSDGGVRSGTALQASAQRLKAAGVPVYTLGLGQERFARDLEISAVQLPAKALRDSTVQAQIQIRQRGFGGREVPLTVLQGQKILSQRMLELSDSTLQTLSLPLHLEEAGPMLLHFELPLQADETVTANNQREVFIEVLDQREKILYVEGEPRFELKFLRRAVADTPNLQVVTLLRTGDSKFYRLGIDDPEQLQNGFPVTEEELFQYRGLIIGNVEASFFSAEQQRMLVDFLGRRGGGVLFLGGKHAFAEGGYADSPVAETLPVVLDTPRSGYQREVQLLPTALGRKHALSQLASVDDDAADNLAHWQQLPAVTIVNPLFQSKPGAAVLLQAEAPNLLGLAYQRYGRGISVALTAQNTWVWQMHADVAPDNQSHEIFWRQLLSWLVSETPQRIEVSHTSGQVLAGAETTLPVQLVDAAYRPLSGASVELQLIGPSGQEQHLLLPEQARAAGSYSASILTPEAGLYELQIKATANDEELQRIAYVNASATGEEFYRAELQADVLRRLARDTGGTYFTAANAEGLARAIQPTPATAMTVQHYELWDMPLLLILLLLALSLDWAFRRWRGLR